MHCKLTASALLATSLAVTAMPSQAITTEQLNRQVQKLNQRLAAQDQRFRVNGYASFGISQSDEAVPYNGVSDELDFRRFTRAGIQMSFAVNPSSSVVTQIVARGENDFSANMEWAYYRHQFSSELSGKIGRIRAPYYMLSEYLDVGYAVPWAQMPAETYSLLNTFANIDGIDLTWDTEMGDYGLQVQGIYGKTTTDDFVLNDIFAVGATLLADSWSARIAHAQAAVSAVSTGETGIIIAGSDQLYGNGAGAKDGSFTSIGFRYDPGDILLLGEYTISEADGVVQDETTAYITAGYRMGQWMPHITYGIQESTDDEDRILPAAIPAATDLTSPELPAGTIPELDGVGGAGNGAGDAQVLLQASSESDSTRIGLGLRYDYDAGVALKIQYDIIEADKAGLFSFEEYISALGSGSAPDKVNVLTISIDTVF